MTLKELLGLHEICPRNSKIALTFLEVLVGGFSLLAENGDF